MFYMDSIISVILVFFVCVCVIICYFVEFRGQFSK